MTQDITQTPEEPTERKPLGGHDEILLLAAVAESAMVKQIFANRKKLGEIDNPPDPVIHLCLLAREVAGLTSPAFFAPPDALELFQKLLTMYLLRIVERQEKLKNNPEREKPIAAQVAAILAEASKPSQG